MVFAMMGTYLNRPKDEQPDYRHVTNLQTPIDDVDRGFLDALGEYKLGEPVKTTVKCHPVSKLKERGVVGLYTTLDALNSAKARKRTGWRQMPLGIWRKQKEWSE